MSRPFAVVTGASNGIGLELARQFASHGYDLMIVSRGHGLEEAAEELRASGGGKVLTVTADLSTDEGNEKLVAAIESAGRPLDALALNAGAGAGGAFIEGTAERSTSLEDELALIRLNVVSVVHLAKRLLPAMVARGEGRVLITTSISGLTPVPYEAVYGASKAFTLSFAEALGYELKDTGVTVTALLPQQTETNFFHNADEDDTRIGSGKKADPAEVARQGFEALMAGRDKVIGGSTAAQIQYGLLNNLIPEPVKLAQRAKASEPGGAKG